MNRLPFFTAWCVLSAAEDPIRHFLLVVKQIEITNSVSGATVIYKTKTEDVFIVTFNALNGSKGFTDKPSHLQHGDERAFLHIIQLEIFTVGDTFDC